MTGPAPPLSCPAREGNGADINSAKLVLIVEDCVTGADGRPTVTEAFGYFRLPGQEHDEDVLLAGGLEVPVGSPIAQIAHRVAASRRRTRRAAALLRDYVARCPCTARDECSALTEISLLRALERANE